MQNAYIVYGVADDPKDIAVEEFSEKLQLTSSDHVMI